MRQIKIFLTGIFCLVVCGANAQMAAKVTWDYPVRYGTPEWENLKTIEEQFNAYNIPDEIIKKISTEELVKVCLAYPEWGLMNAYNSRQNGFANLVGLFNGFRELFNRNDAAIELMKAYNKLNPLTVEPDWTPLQQGQYSFQITKIEMFLCQKAMIEKLGNTDVLILKEMVVSKYQKKKTLPEIYSLWALSPTVGVYLEILKKEKPALLESRTEINYFSNYLMTDDIQFLDSIVEQLK